MPKAKNPGQSAAWKKSYELFVPLVSESGKTLPKQELADLKTLLITQFGGLTHYPQKSKGFWKIGTATFRDEIIILRVLCDRSSLVTTFWQDLKLRLEKQWQQKELLILIHDVHVL